MSYQVLARKYRPRSFETLVGQEHVVRALTHALEQKRLHHAWLFTGTRGVGKTTLSRILAKSLNCQGADGQGDVTAQPCGVCEACVAIDAGRFVDYIEMDAASNRGVDEMAQLLEQAVYAPSNARYKVYMIDEVHMLSSHAFNAMLKTLEEPPEHVKFILATTDPQKIPVTVLSRCLQFNLKQMPPGHIIGHLENILGQEGIEYDPPALRLLAQGAQGSMRDALSLTDQAIAYSAGRVTLDAVQGMLGALDQSYLLRLLDALAAGEGETLLAVADEMAARSLSWNTALQDLGSLLHKVALAQAVPAALAGDLPGREDILRLAGLFQPDEVQLYYQVAVHGRNELGLAPDEYAGFTMALLRMLAFKPTGSEPPAAPPSGKPGAAIGSRVGPGVGPGLTPAASPAAGSSVGAASAPAAPAASSPLQAARAAAAAAPSAPPRPAEPAPAAPASRNPNSPARAALEAARGAMRNAAAPRGAGSSFAPPPPPPSAPSLPPSSPPPVARGTAPGYAMPGESRPPWEDEGDGGHAVAVMEPALEYNARPTPVPPAFAAEAAARPAPGAGVEQDAPSSAPAATIAAAPAAAVVEPKIPGWEGDWPTLAAALPLRGGVAQQLALQSQLMQCEGSEGNCTLHLRIPVDTLRSAGSPDKVADALVAHLGGRFSLTTEVGPVTDTASIRAEKERQRRQLEAEQKIQDDPFVQALMREFDASVVPGSVRPN